MSAERRLREAAKVLRERARRPELLTERSHPVGEGEVYAPGGGTLADLMDETLADLMDEAGRQYLVERGYASDHLVTLANLILGDDQ